MTADEAAAWWFLAFGSGVAYGELTTKDVLCNVNIRGSEFARAVHALESAMPHPNPDVLGACNERLAAVR